LRSMGAAFNTLEENARRQAARVGMERSIRMKRTSALKHPG
jgi:hypothetical protein